MGAVDRAVIRYTLHRPGLNDPGALFVGGRCAVDEGKELVVLCVDDHAVLRSGLRMLLESVDSSVRVREAGSLDEALESLTREPVSVVLLELAVCGEDCTEPIARIVDQSGIPVLVFSKYPYDDRVVPALQAGACGYVNETDDVDVFVETLRRAAGGEYILDSEVARKVVLRMRELATHPAASPSVDGLTGRELEILDCVCQGNTNRQIGLDLGISESTVKNHMHALFHKLHVYSRSQAATEALRRGLVKL